MYTALWQNPAVPASMLSILKLLTQPVNMATNCFQDALQRPEATAFYVNSLDLMVYAAHSAFTLRPELAHLGAAVSFLARLGEARPISALMNSLASVQLRRRSIAQTEAVMLPVCQIGRSSLRCRGRWRSLH